MTYSEIYTEVEGLYTQLQVSTPSDVDLLMARLDWLATQLARSGQLLAEAEHCYTQKEASMWDVHGTHLATLSPTMAKRYLDSRLADEAKLVTLCNRLNSSFTHGIDAIRSILSAEKALSPQRPYDPNYVHPKYP